MQQNKIKIATVTYVKYHQNLWKFCGLHEQVDLWPNAKAAMLENNVIDNRNFPTTCLANLLYRISTRSTKRFTKQTDNSTYNPKNYDGSIFLENLLTREILTRIFLCGVIPKNIADKVEIF